VVAPITGPIVTSLDKGAFGLEIKQKWRQSPPFNLTLPYRMDWYWGWRRSISTEFDTDVTTRDVSMSWGGNIPDSSRRYAACYNQAYERLQSAISDSAGWAENIAQAGKTRDTVVRRASQLARTVTAIRHGRFGEAARILRVPVPSRVSNKKAVAQNFLEYEYGVKPVIKDLQSSLRLLCTDPGARDIKASASDYCSDVTTTGSYPSNYTRQQIVGRLGITLRANVRVTNPNLFLANQLGLLDLALPWKLIPFSFIVDWFVNVEQVISSLTDHFGLTLTDPRTSVLTRTTLTTRELSTYMWGGNEYYNIASGTVHHVGNTRETGISGPSLVVKPFKGFSLQRGAQAIALVLAVFGR
jgi:hypothetical protein